MPNTPQPKSYQEIEKGMIQTFVAKTGVNDLTPGSVIRSILESAALVDFKNQANIIAALNSIDIDRAEGADLDNIGIAKGVTRPQALAATGFVTIKRLNTTKVATKIYAGAAAPPIGSLTINISAKDGFPNSGAVYIGRGSNNVEGPINYSAITPVGSYFQMTLTAPTTKNHNLNESVVLAQGGDQVVSAGTIVQTKQNATSPSVTFLVVNTVTLPDGEDSLSDIAVSCTEIGTIGNVAAGAISEFATDPFPGAGVTNPTAYVTGRDKMSDIDYRLLIKNFEQNKTKGTDLAIRSAAVGTQSTDDNKSVASAQLRKPAQRNEPAILFIDDGTAYQPIFSGRGFEQVIENANGGEKFLQLQREDITKALVETSFTAPFAITGSYVLAVEVGGVRSEHTFQNSDFATQNAADTFEVVNSINSNTSLLFSARASKNSKNIILFAKSFENEDIKVVSPANSNAINANDYMGFAENLTYSLRLYKNDVLLLKDGEVPTIFTKPQSLWSIISGSKTLIVQLDQQSSPVTYTFQDADFVPFGYAVMSETVPLSVWANVFNAIIPGITATVQGNQIKLVSNKGASNNAKISIQGGTLRTLIFPGTGTIEDLGRASDYSLNRSTGQIQLATPLSAGDNITAGSKNTKAFVTSAEISAGSITLPAGSGTTVAPKMWVILDDTEAEYIPNGATVGSTITITSPSTNIWRFTSSNTSAFVDVLPGDWVVIADNAIRTHDIDFIGHFRVINKSNSWFEIRITDSLVSASGALTLLGTEKITFVRSTGTIQPINLLTGLNTLTAITNNINTQLQGGSASVSNGKFINISSNTYGLNGSIMIAGVSANADGLGFLPGDKDDATITHTAFSESGRSELTTPSFIHDAIATGTTAIPPLNFTSGINLLTNGASRNALVSFLDRYGDESNNKNVEAQIANISGTNVTLRAESRLKELLAGDRYFVAEPFNFAALDSLVAIIDRDGVNKAFNIPMGRKGQVSVAVSANQFNAYDADAGPTANFPDQFGDNFDFNDFKVHLRARQIVDPTGPNNKMLIRAAKYGPIGEKIRFGIDYPASPSAALTHTVQVKKHTDIKVFLSSGAERLGGAWDNTTQFDVTNPIANTYRYTWNGTGTAPNFTGAGILVGDIVNISVSSDFNQDNTGLYKVTAVTANWFEISNFDGVLENNIQLNSASELRFYPLVAAANTANLIGTYVNNNLADYISVQQLQSGAGVVETSTWDDTSGANSFYQLDDGENWVLTSNIGTTSVPVNSFTLKENLALPESDPDYTLVGEYFYLIPVRSGAIVRFLNKFAVTGLSSLANINASTDAGKIQIYSNLFGTSGAVQVSGGAANEASGAVTTAGSATGQANIEDQPNGISRTGSTVTVTCTDRHDLAVGDTVIISGCENSNFDGRFVITSITAKTFQYSETYTYASIAASPSGATRSAGVITFNTTTPHKLIVGDRVTVGSIANSSFNGNYLVVSTPTSTQFTVNTSIGNPVISASPIGASRSSGVATITTTAAHNIVVGDQVVVSGVADTSFNGTFTVTAATATTFDYSNAGPNATSGGGTVTSVSTGSGSITSIFSGGGTVAIPFAKINIAKANQSGFQTGQYIELSNTAVQAKDLDFDGTTQIQLSNPGAFGRVTRSVSGTFQTARTHSGNNTTQIKISKQGQYVCLSHTGTGTAPNFTGGGVQEGDWLRITGAFSVANQGIFQVLRVFGSNSLYIENASAIEEEVVLSANSNIALYSYDSVMPGDKFIIASDVLGALNIGTYTVKDTPFPTATQFDVTVNFPAVAGPVALGTNFNNVTVSEKSTFKSVRKIINMAQDPTDANAVTLILDTDRVANKVAPSVGGSVSAISKLAFKTTVQTGEDSYKYYGGLISAVGKKIRGQAEDPVGFPGVAAAGSYIEITSPLPREITMSIVVKNLSGIPFSTIKSRVQSAVAAYINSLGTGEAVIFSRVISVVQELNGVQAMAISAPVYDQTNLQIVINEDEKAVVTNINNITVSLST